MQVYYSQYFQRPTAADVFIHWERPISLDIFIWNPLQSTVAAYHFIFSLFSIPSNMTNMALRFWVWRCSYLSSVISRGAPLVQQYKEQEESEFGDGWTGHAWDFPPEDQGPSPVWLYVKIDLLLTYVGNLHY